MRPGKATIFTRVASLCALWMVLAAGLGCATPVGVKHVDARSVHRELTANVLSTGRPSAPTIQVLHRLGLFERFEREPETTLTQLHQGLAPTADQDRVFALAELSFLLGEASGERHYFLASAVYAYAFLFPGEEATPPQAFDPRFRLACDFYNRGLTEGLVSPDGEEVRLDPGRFDLLFGSLEIESSAPDFRWGGYRLEGFVSAADLRVRGLRNRYRRSGIGAPLAAALSKTADEETPPPGHRRIPPGLQVPVTALLRLDEPRRALAGGALHGTLELYSQDDTPQVTIAGRDVPLELETTSALALTLEGSQVWRSELEGFRFGERLFGVEGIPDGLFMLHPYRPGRIPLVLVHGTASSPARWTELVNELENDPRIWQRYQIWLFMYNTGNPVALSGSLLREAIHETVSELDPQQLDAALRRMVVIGHSQGGLLTKLTAVDSGTRFWDAVSEVPLDEFELKAETRELLENALFVKPVPFVKRLVFVATPHRGSYLTTVRWLGLAPANWARGLIQLPGVVTGAVAEIVINNPDEQLLHALDRAPTSVDNMTPGNPFLEALAATPVVPGVVLHSIIAVEGEGPPEEGGDGVVKYSSAHIDGVASELVVHSGHSVQAHPETIEEIRRILLEHVEASAEAPAEAP